MKKLLLIFYVLIFSLNALASDEFKEKPVQHLKLNDVTSMEAAEKIFIEKTSEINSK